MEKPPPPSSPLDLTAARCEYPVARVMARARTTSAVTTVSVLTCCVWFLPPPGVCSKPARRMFRELMEKLGEESFVFEGLPASCQRHGRKAMLVNREGFRSLAPEGGCTEPCVELLLCGHRCHLKCHNQPHSEVKCREGVTRPCPAGHPVPTLCSAEVLPPCQECAEIARQEDERRSLLAAQAKEELAGRVRNHARVEEAKKEMVLAERRWKQAEELNFATLETERLRIKKAEADVNLRIAQVRFPPPPPACLKR